MGSAESEREVTQSCPTLCDSVDYSPAGEASMGFLPGEARILEWVAISFSRRAFQPRDGTRVSCTAGRLPSEPSGAGHMASAENSPNQINRVPTKR